MSITGLLQLATSNFALVILAEQRTECLRSNNYRFKGFDKSEWCKRKVNCSLLGSLLE